MNLRLNHGNSDAFEAGRRLSRQEWIHMTESAPAELINYYGLPAIKGGAR